MYLHAHSILQHWRDICISTCVYGNKTVVLSLFTCCTKLEQQKKSLVEIEYYIYYKSKETKNMILEWKTLMIIPKSFSLFPYYFIVAIAKGQQNVCANLSILCPLPLIFWKCLEDFVWTSSDYFLSNEFAACSAKTLHATFLHKAAVKSW